ncbi:aspartic peptidase domain-containing protein [Blyttiomyces helicus]|uniref:Aspartic peptidase domain-containing protein n=1 Tax=Blyttiomyces helicus TaxID=388810 RepID=A0A4V1IQJ3_9FUNG|nr:aspartic peptidase domain-containing protein [Blyttiomyces helicus]|eukprot:RKO86757.1 aspartic peptidase domain-containing protein [Blyttiomyces helicus]
MSPIPFSIIQYGIGQASGEIYKANYTLAGLTASNAFFGVATFEASMPGTQGLLGLCFPFLNDTGGILGQVPGSQSPVEALGFSSFGFYLPFAAENDTGELTVNGYDSSRTSGPMTYGFWQFSVAHGRFSAGDSAGNFGATTSAVANTGSTIIQLPTPMAQSIWQAVNATTNPSQAGFATIDCDAQSPEVVFTFSTTSYAIPASAYIIPNGRHLPLSCGSVDSSLFSSF